MPGKVWARRAAAHGEDLWPHSPGTFLASRPGNHGDRQTRPGQFRSVPIGSPFNNTPFHSQRGGWRGIPPSGCHPGGHGGGQPARRSGPRCPCPRGRDRRSPSQPQSSELPAGHPQARAGGPVGCPGCLGPHNPTIPASMTLTLTNVHLAEASRPQASGLGFQRMSVPGRGLAIGQDGCFQRLRCEACSSSIPMLLPCSDGGGEGGRGLVLSLTDLRPPN